MRTAGMLCRSHASTAVCIPGDPRSMIVSRRADRTLVEHSRLVDLKYSRLMDSRRFMPREEGRSVTLPMVLKKERAPPKPTNVSSSPPPSSGHVFQVVVMRVSIHCQGCAGKVRKHISKMEGVTSFSIDLESKRVTVMGHVSPVGVLESISKVKRAEFWPC
ncbi:protein SODIUM POTASSIUM ROOT DEFECTIVE 1-like [Phoenix dactylifera]|uniref:Protein SODIUM POTASSIUM ROOT DEFECTIVE 1-like n=1 Tax=Phoenix dactylifera TaxID=42345 RepID=A0A8B7CYP9_PHODC|nr:protein SODIUM POTASSIUM ROOT DEFECTIVE 1-like [Phoenix dactylifera]